MICPPLPDAFEIDVPEDPENSFFRRVAKGEFHGFPGYADSHYRDRFGRGLQRPGHRNFERRNIALHVDVHNRFNHGQVGHWERVGVLDDGLQADAVAAAHVEKGPRSSVATPDVEITLTGLMPPRDRDSIPAASSPFVPRMLIRPPTGLTGTPCTVGGLKISAVASSTTSVLPGGRTSGVTERLIRSPESTGSCFRKFIVTDFQ